MFYLYLSRGTLFQWMARSVLCEFLTKKHTTTILLRCCRFFPLTLLDSVFVSVNSILFMFCFISFYCGYYYILFISKRRRNPSWETRLATTIATAKINQIHSVDEAEIFLIPQFDGGNRKKTPLNREKMFRFSAVNWKITKIIFRLILNDFKEIVYSFWWHFEKTAFRSGRFDCWWYGGVCARTESGSNVSPSRGASERERKVQTENDLYTRGTILITRIW